MAEDGNIINVILIVLIVGNWWYQLFTTYWYSLYI